MKVLLNEMSWTEAKAYFQNSDIAILPVGSNEQHGTQNPLGTDHLIAKAVAEEAAKRAEVLCLPTVPFGVSSHHKQFWGTIYISPESLKSYVEEACLSLSYYGIRKIVIVNGHGGNLGALKEMARGLRRKKILASIFQWWHASPNLLNELFKQDEMGHAAAAETSVNLALHSHLVNRDEFTDEKPRHPIVQTDGITLPLDTVDYTASGVFGKSTTASEEKGRRIFEVVVQELVRHVKLLEKTKNEDLTQKTKV